MNNSVFKCISGGLVGLAVVFSPVGGASAQTVDPALCDPYGQIFYINGVRTQRWEAALEASALEEALRATNDEDVLRAIPVRLTYNSTNIPEYADLLRDLDAVSPFLAVNGLAAEFIGSAADLFEATFQRLVDDVDGLERIDIARALAADSYEAYQQRYERAASRSVFDQIRNLNAEISHHATAALRLGARSLITSGDLSGHVELFRNTINRGQRVVVVAYSQGNLFANLAHEALTPNEREAFGIVSVATPAASNESGGAHVSVDTDGLVEGLRVFLGGLNDLFTDAFPPPCRRTLIGEAKT
jgi:hypothetical protein